MLHIELINQIIEAEKSARAMYEEASEQLQGLPESLKRKRDELERSYMERADHRIEDVRRSENVYADEQIEQLARQLRNDLAASEKTARENGEKWAEALFEQIIKYPLEG